MTYIGPGKSKKKPEKIRKKSRKVGGGGRESCTNFVLVYMHEYINYTHAYTHIFVCMCAYKYACVHANVPVRDRACVCVKVCMWVNLCT